MGLDLYFTTNDQEIIHVAISEVLHSNIFTPSTRWSSCKVLRKISDYYRADCVLRGSDVSDFISELNEIKSRMEYGSSEIASLIDKVKSKEIVSLRICSD